MRRKSFAITILGLFLLLLLFNLPPKTIQSEEQLKNFQPNQKLLIKGKVIKETFLNKNKIYQLDNNLSLQCELNCPSYINQNIEATTKLEKYNQNSYLKILKIKTLN